MHFLVLQYLEYIAYVIFCADIERLLQYFNNISDRFRNILAIVQYFQEIFLQYFLNIWVLCGKSSASDVCILEIQKRQKVHNY